MIQRFRRLRGSETLRNLSAEVHLELSQMMMPYFVVEGKGIKSPLPSLEGQFHFSADTLLKEVRELYALGVHSILLFGIPHEKDGQGSQAWNAEGPVPQALRLLKKEMPSLCIAADVCLCGYTSSGHCGVLKNGEVDNDATLPLLQKAALCYAEAGADIIAPSDMMDGRVGALRAALDEGGFSSIPIMAYSSKYASSYYGPFREAAGCTPKEGNRKGYQMDFRRAKESLAKAYTDLSEGADILMVKPGLAYLDILYRLSQETLCPLAVYNVSGEYALVKSAVKAGLADEKAMVLENMHAFLRAGANIIISYHAKDVALWRRDEP